MASAATPPSTPTQFSASASFLTLPIEIRCMIYAAFLRPNAPVFVKEIEGKYSIFPFQCTEEGLHEPWTLAGVNPGDHIAGRGPRREALEEIVAGRAEPEVLPIIRWHNREVVENPGPGDERMWLAIMGVCRTTYQETARMVYSRRFVLQNTRVMFAFLSALEPWTRDLLSVLEFRSWATPSPAFSTLIGMHHLQSVEIGCQFHAVEILPDEILRQTHNAAIISAQTRNLAVDNAAYKIYINCRHWLRHLFHRGGIAEIQRVLRLPIIIGFAETTPDQERADQERFWSYLELVLAAHLI